MQQKLLLVTKDTTSGNTYILLGMERGSCEVVFVQVWEKPRQAPLQKGAKLFAQGFFSSSPSPNPHSRGPGRPTWQGSIFKQL